MEKEEVKVALYTNGVYVDVDRVVKYKNISLLSFSVNSATEETHQKVMHLSNFAVVKENYEKARKLAPFPVRTTFVITQDNVHEVELYKKTFDKTATTGFSNWTGDKHDDLERKGERVPCWVVFRQMMILWDGRVVPCCSDYDGKQIMGDANKQTLKEIWESSSWLREKHKRCEFDTPICKECNYNVANKYA
jgi:radical SAM protein with 4Fe4S-binding SPASM domain